MATRKQRLRRKQRRKGEPVVSVQSARGLNGRDDDVRPLSEREKRRQYEERGRYIL